MQRDGWEWCAGLTVAEVVAVCAREGIACAPVNTYTQAAQDQHVRERDMLQETTQEDGSRAPITGPAAKFSRTPMRIRSGSPALGAHNDAILRNSESMRLPAIACALAK